MARTKQTPRKSTGGRASIKQLATKVALSMTFAAIALARPTLTSGSTSSGSTSSGSTSTRSTIPRSASSDSVFSRAPSWGSSPPESPPGSPNPQVVSWTESEAGSCYQIEQGSYRCSVCDHISFYNSDCDNLCHEWYEVTHHTRTYLSAC